MRRFRGSYSAKASRDGEEYDDEDEEDDPTSRKATRGGGRLFKNRDFRDLNPKAKKARKEPKKPWGKKERLFVFLALIITAGFSVFLYLSSHNLLKVPNFSKVKTPKVNINIPNLGEETIIYKK